MGWYNRGRFLLALLFLLLRIGILSLLTDLRQLLDGNGDREAGEDDHPFNPVKLTVFSSPRKNMALPSVLRCQLQPQLVTVQRRFRKSLCPVPKPHACFLTAH